VNGPALEARLLGLVHLVSCPDGARVEVFDGTRPGKACPPDRFEAVSSRTGKPTGRWFERGPARPGPATPLRVARCVACGSQVVVAAS